MLSLSGESIGFIMEQKDKQNLSAFEKLRIGTLLVALVLYIILWQISKKATELNALFNVIVILQFMSFVAILAVELLNCKKQKKTLLSYIIVAVVVVAVSMVFFFRLNFLKVQINTNTAYQEYTQQYINLDSLPPEEAEAIRNAYQTNRLDPMTKANQSFLISALITFGVAILIALPLYYINRKNTTPVDLPDTVGDESSSINNKSKSFPEEGRNNLQENEQASNEKENNDKK